MNWLLDLHITAYVLGLWERARLGDAFGRTHPTDAGWDEAYDRGANLADWFSFWKGA